MSQSKQPNQYSAIDIRTVEVRGRRFMRVLDCAVDGSCSKGYVSEQIKNGKLKAYRLKKMILIATVDWDDFLDREAKPVTPRKKIEAVKSA